MKSLLPLIAIILVGIFLRIDRLSDLMPFIGDQGWFYLSARDLVLSGHVPLVGITSSHTWLHQGPIWTYMLAPVLLISKFNPVSGAYLTALLGSLSIFAVYKLGADYFFNRLGMIAALLFATSPLIVLHSRFAYHTTPIPLFVLLFLYCLMGLINGKKIYLAGCLFFLGILYNLELATVVYVPLLLFFLILGFYKKEKWFKRIANRKIVLLSLLALIIPMAPILIYDVNNGFPQTVKYGGWFFYKFAQMLGFIDGSVGDSLSKVVTHFFDRYRLLVFPSNIFISFCILVLSLFSIGSNIKRVTSAQGIIFASTAISLVAVIFSGTASEAYLPMLFPSLIIAFAYLLDILMNTRIKVFAFLVFLFIGASNFYALYTNNYYAGRKEGFGKSLEMRIKASRQVIKIAGDKKFLLQYRGEGGQFPSSTMNYEYLVWYLSGKKPISNSTNTIYISETEKRILINPK